MNIKNFRESLNMTQQALADSVGVKRSTVAMWEKGVIYPRVDVLIELSNLFNCTIDELVKGEQNAKQ